MNTFIFIFLEHTATLELLPEEVKNNFAVSVSVNENEMPLFAVVLGRHSFYKEMPVKNILVSEDTDLLPIARTAYMVTTYGPTFQVDELKRDRHGEDERMYERLMMLLRSLPPVYTGHLRRQVG